MRDGRGGDGEPLRVFEHEREVATRYIAQLDAARVFDHPIVTEVTKIDRFYAAEDYHQDYAAKHPDQPYIRYVALPEVAKLKKHYADRLKTTAR